MDSPLTRRETLLAGSMAGAAMLFTGKHVVADDAPQPEKHSWEILRAEIASPELISTQVHKRPSTNLPPIREVEAKFIQNKASNGVLLASSYRTTCEPARTTVLKVNGQDLKIAEWVSFGLGSIEWKAGEGWPLYHQPDPRHDYSIKMKWDAYIHAILVGCRHNDGSITFTTPYAKPGVYNLGPGTVVAFVNDDSYDDNRGYFDIDVFGWK